MVSIKENIVRKAPGSTKNVAVIFHPSEINTPVGTRYEIISFDKSEDLLEDDVIIRFYREATKYKDVEDHNFLLAYPKFFDDDEYMSEFNIRFRRR